jgi:hypothetical protein
MGWRHDSSGSIPVWKVWSPEFKPQSHINKKTQHNKKISSKVDLEMKTYETDYIQTSQICPAASFFLPANINDISLLLINIYFPRNILIYYKLSL